MTTYIVENLHNEERVESKKQEYRHMFDTKSWNNQKWIIIE